MILIWSFLFIELSILSLFKPLITDFETIIVFVIAFHIGIVSLHFLRFEKGLREIFFIGFGLRLAAMFWDVYARKLYILPHSGSDSEGFLMTAIQISGNLSLLTEEVYGGLYSKVLGILFHFTDSERLLGQYVNVILGITIILMIHRILVTLNVNQRTMKHSVVLIIFFPHAIIFSGILLRENIITLLVTLSFYYFVKWYKHSGILSIVLSMIILLTASTIHSGVIGILVGYVFMLMFYKRDQHKLIFNRNTLFIFALFLVFSLFSFMEFRESIFSKFNGLNEFNDLYDSINDRIGSSAYLTGLQIDSAWKLFLFAPIKMFYFLIAPLPLDWRGFNDILSFFMDSLVYLYILIYAGLYFKQAQRGNPLIIGLLIMIVSVVLIVGLGVANAGTAIRHRHKIYPLLIIFYSMLEMAKQRDVKRDNSDYRQKTQPGGLKINPVIDEGGDETKEKGI